MCLHTTPECALLEIRLRRLCNRWRSAGSSNKVAIVDSGEDARVSRLEVGEGMQGGGIGRTGTGDEMQFTNLRSDSSYASHSMAVRVQ